MSTGPQHYQEAQDLLAIAKDPGNGNHEDRMELFAAAQVHATLALAAATAMCSGLSIDADYRDHDYKAWDDVAGVNPS